MSNRLNMSALMNWGTPAAREHFTPPPKPQEPERKIVMATNQLKEQKEVFSQMNRVIEIFKASKGEIRPHYIVTGPSGSGKSHLTEMLALGHDLGFLEVNAAQLTKEGTAGNSLSKALAPLRTMPGLNVVFADEFDKLFISGNSNSDMAHEITHGVQNEFLKVLESRTTSVYGDYGKYLECDVSKALFVFAGAFNGEENIGIDRLREFGIKTEFLGRVPLVYNLQKLSLDSMRAALEESPLLAKYLKLFANSKKQTVVDTIMPHIERAHEKNTLGIRIINALLHQYFINGGKLPELEARKTTFQTTLSLDAVAA